MALRMSRYSDEQPDEAHLADAPVERQSVCLTIEGELSEAEVAALVNRLKLLTHGKPVTVHLEGARRNAVVEQPDLQPRQQEALGLVVANPGITHRGLAKELGVKVSYAKVLLSGLVKLGLVERWSRDDGVSVYRAYCQV
jgi:predicted HTH transcriptional regulator